MSALGVGEKAPDFTLKSLDGEEVKLSDLLHKGENLVLAFFPAAWSSVCGSELTLFQEVQDEFTRLNAKVIGISEDNYYSLKAWADAKGLKFPLLSDFHPRGAAAKKYGVLRDDGLAERALFILDPDGFIRYSYLSPIGQNPGADRLIDALEKMQAEQLQGARR